MTDLSAPPDQLTQPGEVLDDTVFQSVAVPLVVERAMIDRLDAMVSELGEQSIGGGWDPQDEILRYTTGHLDDRQRDHQGELAGELRDWTAQLEADGQIRLLLYLWWKCFQLWDRSFAYRTIEAVADAVRDMVAGDAARSAGSDWRQDTWRAVGNALRVMYLDGLIFKQMNLSCADKVESEADKAITELAAISGDLYGALCQLADQPGGSWPEIRRCVSYIRGYADQMAAYYGVMKKTAGALVRFERWLASARKAGDQRSLGLWPLSLDDELRAEIVAALADLAAAKSKLSGHPLSEIEPWEQMLIGLRDLMTARPDEDNTASVLIPRKVWVRYCFPFAVQNDHGRRGDQLLRVSYEENPRHPRPEAPEHPLKVRLREALDHAVGKDRMKVGEPEELAQTEFFQVGENGRFGGIRIPLLFDLTFDPDFLGDVGRRPYRAWLDLNQMGNFCLCVEAVEPMAEISPPRLYRALRAGTPMVFGEPVALTQWGAGEKAGGAAGQPLKWDNLYGFAWGMIKAATDAYFAALEKDLGAPPAPPLYEKGNLHEVVVVQTDGPVAVQSEDIAQNLGHALGGRILLRSVQRAAGTLEEWTRFPPLQHAQASAVVAVPEIGYAGDWFVHTGETTVFGIVAVPAWFRDIYPEVAEFASSWSPVLQLWNRRLQDCLKTVIKDPDSKHDIAPRDAPEKLRYVEQQVRHHLTEINADDLCATLAYRRFLDGVLDAVGVRRLEKELEAQLQAAERLADYFYQQEEKRSSSRRDILLLFIGVFGVFGFADFLALLDTTDFNGHIAFVRLSQDGHWQDLLVLLAFAAAAIGGAILVEIDRLRNWLRWKPKARKGARRKPAA